MRKLQKATFPLLLGIFFSVLAACGGDSSGGPAPASGASSAGESRASRIQNFRLESFTIPVGTTVTWTNLDTAPHTATSGVPPNADGEFDSPNLGRNSTFNYTFNSPGEFPYWCRVHPSMVAVITVQ